LKKFLFIFIFFSCRFLGQVSAPDLRCIEVLSNGDVKLTWVPPADPGGVFFAYEVYASISSSGPFNNIGSVAALSLNTFTHAGAGANVQSRYYFVKSTYGPGGGSSSLPSDTLRSIFLNIISSTPDLKLLYNNIHNPKLSSSANTFTINKEYPASIWNILGITSSVNYADTISVCSASLNYVVELKDNSGCVSTSNIQGGVYSDKKDPDVPVIDSISVLPNGQTILAWQVPRDEDIVKYQIYQNIGGSNTPIDIVNGGNSTSYTFTGTIATNSALALYVAAIDSCNRIGSFSITPTTMLLKTTYDKCAYKTDLFWNAYQGMKGGILEYRIYYSVNGSTFIKVGNTTQTSFTHFNVAPNQNICYFVRVINTSKTITASSNRSCFFSTQVQAAGFVYIQRASVTGTNTNEVKVYVDTTKSSQGIDIWRSEDNFTFNSIGFIAFTGGPYYSFTDENADTKHTSYYYKAVIRDSCNNPRTVSNISKTILLKVEEDKELIFTKHLSWTAYQGFNGGVSGYNIYRVVNDMVSSSPVGTGGPTDTLFTDNIEEEAPNGSKIEYMVEAVEGVSNNYGFLEHSQSNLVPVYLEGKLYVPTAFAPKGKNKIWLPVTHFIDKTEYSVSVFNRWGAKVFETTDDTKGWDGSNSPADIYVYLIRYKNSRGEYKEAKGTVLLFE